MTLTDELKILDDKIKANQAQYDLGREAAKISTLSSKNLLEKYEYLTREDSRHRPSVLEKTEFQYSPLGMSLSKSFKIDNVKNIAKSHSDFNYDRNKSRFHEFYKGYDEFEEMSLDPKYNKMKKFTNLLTDFKKFKLKKPETQPQKEQIMKNIDELYENNYNAYKNDYDSHELSEAKKKKIDYRQFELFDKTDKKLELDGETKNFSKEIKN